MSWLLTRRALKFYTSESSLFVRDTVLCMLQCGLYNIYAIMTFDMRFLHTYLFQSVKGIFTVYFSLFFSLFKVFLQFIFLYFSVCSRYFYSLFFSIFQSVKGIFTA